MKIVLLTLLAGSLLTRALQAQVSNGGFEAGLTGWTYNSGVFIIGIPGVQPIGVDGLLCADIGGGDVTGAMLSQIIPVSPNAFYDLTFFSAANGSGATGLISVGKIDVLPASGTGVALSALTFTNVSPGPMLRELGFVIQSVKFATDASTTNVMLRFVDISPAGGVGVDVAIDAVSVRRVGTCVREMVTPFLSNGSFESGLNHWFHNNGVYIIGNAATQPIGLNGVIAADIGGADIAGAQMWQSIAVVDSARYELTFGEAANGSGVGGLVSVGLVEIEDSRGEILATKTFTNVSPQVMLGTNGFVRHSVVFDTGSSDGCVTVRFRDITADGRGVDVAIDAVQLRLAAVSHNLSIDTYPGVTITGPATGTYRIDFVDQLASPPSWQTLTNVTISELPYLFIDRSAPSRQVPNRFYRATLLTE